MVEGYFSVSRWRKLVNEAAIAASPPGILQEAICPFGFEVLQDPSFLRLELRRFYCYLGSPEHPLINIPVIEETFLQILFSKLQETFPALAEQIIVLAARPGKHILLRKSPYICQLLDGLIVVEHRNTENLLQDYADYLICCLNGLATGTIPEWSRIKSDPMARVRMFQIFIILENLFGHYLGNPPQEWDVHLPSYRNARSSLQFYFDGRIQIEATDAETMAIDFIEIRSKQLLDAVSKLGSHTDDICNIRSKSYHGEGYLSISLSKQIYQSVSTRIIEDYTSFASFS